MKLALFLSVFVILPVLSAREKQSSPAATEMVILDPFQVHGTALGSFAIDIQIVVNAKTKKITKILITQVAENSDAAELGLRVGDEIKKVNGIRIEDLDPKVNRDSQIGGLFLNRRPGDPIELEVVTHRVRQFTLRAQSLPLFR